MLKNTKRIKQVVEEMGGRFEEVIPERNCYYIHIKKRAFLITRNFKIVRNFISGADFTKFKDLTYTLLSRKSIPTPKTVFFFNKSSKNFKEKISELKFPIIIKHAAGSNSVGIFPLIQTITEAKSILEKNLPKYKSMVAQEMIFGKEYRLLVLDKKIIGALEMIRPKVIGDGKTTILKLIREKQKNTKRKTEVDDILKYILKKQGFNLRTVLKKGQEAYIKGNSALDEGGETKDVTDLVHKDITKLCVKASKVIGHYLTGIDVICDDISLDPKQQDFGILEMNGKPDVYIHYEPTHGKPRDVVREIIKFVLKIGATKKSKNV